MHIGDRRGESKGVRKKEILKSEWVKRERGGSGREGGGGNKVER